MVAGQRRLDLTQLVRWRHEHWTFSEMSERARREGLAISPSELAAYAAGEVDVRPSRGQLRALAAALDLHLEAVWMAASQQFSDTPRAQRGGAAAPPPAVAVRETPRPVSGYTTGLHADGTVSATEPDQGPAMRLSALRRLCWWHRLQLIVVDVAAGAWSPETGGGPTGMERRGTLERASECSTCRTLNTDVPDWRWSLPSAEVEVGDPPTHTRPGPGKGWVIVGVAVFASVVALIASAHHSPSTPHTTAPPAVETTQTMELDVSQLKVGDCLARGIDSNVVATVNVGSCHHPHREEVYAVFNLAPGHFAEQKDVDQRGDAGCKKRFGAYIGVDYSSSEMDYIAVTPYVTDLPDDRSVACVVVDIHPDTASLKGARR